MSCSVLQERAAQLLTDPPTDPDASLRQDLTHHEVLTIDDASTRDIDDGLAVEVLSDGRHKLWVHIADPTRWVMQGDPLDVEARHRAKTMYLPTGEPPYLGLPFTICPITCGLIVCPPDALCDTEDSVECGNTGGLCWTFGRVIEPKLTQVKMIVVTTLSLFFLPCPCPGPCPWPLPLALLQACSLGMRANGPVLCPGP